MAKKEFKLAEFLPQRQMSEAFINSFFLALSGGFQDAYTYNCRDEVFSNAQTGNVVLMSQHFMEGRWYEGLRYLLPLLAFAAGVLHTNDVDCQVAGALADQVITEKPFESISQESYDKAVELMKKCQKVICPLKDFGTVNAANRELLRLARELGILAEL